MSDIKVGRPDTHPAKPAHVRGIKEGNAVGNYEKMPGHLPDGRATPRRSTGVNAKARAPIDPTMPTLTPA